MITARLQISFLGLMSLTLLLAFTVSHAQEDADLEFTRTQATLDVIEGEIFAGKATDQKISEAIRRATSLRTSSKQCVNTLEPEVARTDQALKSLGEPSADEAEGIKQERKLLTNQRSQYDGRLAECRILAARTDTLVDRLTQLQQTKLKKHLLSKGLDIRTLVLDSLRNPAQWWDFSKNLLTEGFGVKHLNPQQMAVLAMLASLGIAFGLWLKRGFRSFALAIPADTFSSRLIQAMMTSVAHYLPALILFGVYSVFMLLHFRLTRPIPFIALLCYGLFGFALVLTGIRTLLNPFKPARQITPLPEKLDRAMARRLTVLALLSLIGALLFATLVSQSLAQNAFNLARSIYITFLIINITSLIWLIGRIPALVRSNRGLRFILLLLLIIILAAELLGYRNLSYYLLVGLAGTVGIFVVFWVIGKLLSEFFSGLDEGRRSWQHTVRKRLGLQPHEPIPGLTALRFLTGLVLWATLGLFLLRVWGLSDAGLALILEYLVDGFQVGTIRVVPSKVLIGLLIFALLLTATRWFKGLLAKRWIRRTRLDAGAREAMVSITGYSGFIIAALVGLSMAGFNFQNIAIVAGALSVGIGFGLQNVVNNFVSGLIMLFERPVRTGDWVVVGATQGWVKRIRVRATEVQTFDRTDVIVPNSEFISNQVSNWTLRDRYGRIIIPVGVDYGSDIHLVKKLLLKVAHSHPQILIEGGVVHAPKVLFLAFGDSALLFEIRCFVKNIAEKWDIVSDINFEIARVFEEHNIQIPFPQRDLHVRDWPSATPLNKQTNGQGFLGSKDSSVKPSDPNPHDDSTSSA